jgi:S-disulfanyl-L-cysteine oxidoreductase SoxD
MDNHDNMPSARRKFPAGAGATAMPWDRPQSLAPNEVYAVSAYVLYLSGIVPESAVLDAATLPQVRMPNRDGFISPDPRPDTR